MSQRVRRADIKDKELLVEMMREFYAESRTVFPERQAADAFGVILRDDRIGLVWVIERNEEVAGYAVLTAGYSMEYGGGDAFVDDLFVRRGHRRCGLGRMAMEAILEECRTRGIRAVHLEVVRENVAAKELYGRFGFEDKKRQLMTVCLKTD